MTPVIALINYFTIAYFIFIQLDTKINGIGNMIPGITKHCIWTLIYYVDINKIHRYIHKMQNTNNLIYTISTYIDNSTLET